MAEYDQFIRDILASAKYLNIQNTLKDVREALASYKELKPISEMFFFNNGTEKNLLALSGTIPINSNIGSRSHNMTIRIWLLDTYPNNAPMVFVEPSHDSTIKASKYIDPDGTVKLQYLEEWEYGQSDLFTLIQMLMITFQEESPVCQAVKARPPPVKFTPRTVFPPPTHNSQVMPSLLQSHGLRNVWVCTECTFKNHLGVDECEMCETAKPGAETGVQTPALKILQDVTAFCLTNGCSEFVDDSFPPANKSLYFNYRDPPKNNNVTQWLRPGGINTERDPDQPWTIMRNPEPHDISQGVLGNCWFLVSLAVVAEKEELLRKILVTQNISPVGAYVICLFKDGCWTDVIIDDVLPCDKYGRLAYSKAKHRQLWVPLIEKGMAKLHGCYEALVAGNAFEGLTALTGFSCETLRLNEVSADTDMLWVQLLSSHTAGFLIAASCGNHMQEVNKDTYKEMGLLANHAYSVLEIVVTNEMQLLRLRNPWGMFSWNGDWSDKSDLWNKQMKDELKPSSGDQGVFWINFHDFRKYFDHVDICKVRLGWHSLNLQEMFAPISEFEEQSCYSLRVTETTEIDFNIYQRSARNIDSAKNEQREISIILLQGDFSNATSGNQWKLGNVVAYSKRAIKGSVGVNAIVKPGKYLLLPICLSQKRSQDKFAITIHSAKKILCEQIKKLPSKFVLTDAVIKLAMETGDKKELQLGHGYYSMATKWGASVVVVENSHRTDWLLFKYDCSGSPNLVSSRGSFTVVDAIAPQHRQVIMVLSQKNATDGYQTNSQMKYQFSRKAGLHGWAPCDTNNFPEIGFHVAALHTPRKIT